jgi:TonB family protein
MVDSTTPAHTIRPAVATDASELARLVTALGHPTTVSELVDRWGPWTAAGNTALVAVMPDGALAGVATLHQTVVLHRPKPVGRITALVVDASVRGQGIGRSLVAAAESLLANAGCGLLEITSNVRLTEAHSFYGHLGYEQTSFRFAKVLSILLAALISTGACGGSSSSQTAPSGSPTQPITVYEPGAGVSLPTVVREVKPSYTAQALAARIQGAVLMSAVVLADGTVGDVTVLKSLDTVFGLDAEAVRAAKQWLFNPGVKDGQAVAVRVTIEMTFTLRE